jgi:hypothetical protein
VDRENIRASFDHGLLRVEMPKTAEARPRQIKISGESSSGPDKKSIDVQTR